MTAFLMSKTFCSGTGATIPYATILERLDSAVSGGDAWGAWVGPPRIVRRRMGQCAWDMYVTRLYEVPGTLDAYGLATVQAELGGAVDRAFRETGEDWGSAWGPTSFINFDPARNGTRDFWASGQASRTRTSNNWDAGTPENPTGPDSILPREVSWTEAAGQGAREILQNTGVVPVVVGAAVIVSLIYVGPALRAWLSSRQQGGGRELEYDERDFKRPPRRR